MFRDPRQRGPEVVELLVNDGAAVNAKDKRGQTALNVASAKRQPEIVQYLKTRGAK